jgi:hypothetical protein
MQATTKVDTREPVGLPPGTGKGDAHGGIATDLNTAACAAAAAHDAMHHLATQATPRERRG